MASTLPVNIPIPTESAIASYSFTDIASGVGYQFLYPVQTLNGSGAAYSLVSSTVHIDTNTLGFNNNNSGYVSFDSSPFLSPRMVKGKLYFTGQFFRSSGSAQCQVKISHVRGATVTDIGAAITSAGISASLYFNFEWDIAQTQFKVGDILRLSMNITAVGLYVPIDPSGAQPSGIAPSKLYIPFDLDL